MLNNIERNSDPNSSGEAELANEINQAFLRPMTDFTPLFPDYWQTNTDGRSEAFCVSEFSVFKKLIALNPNKAEGPDGIPNWILKESADSLATAVTDIINTSYKERRLPSSWKFANIIPIPKAKPVRNINKDLRPISLTPIVSKIAEDYVVNSFVKPLDPNQYGTVPRSSTTQALISMLYFLNASTDGNGATTAKFAQVAAGLLSACCGMSSTGRMSDAFARHVAACRHMAATDCRQICCKLL